MPSRTERYTMLNGEVVEYPTPAPRVAAFLRRVIDAANDPDVGEMALTELVYGKENPILDQNVLPHHGVVTRAVFADPLYHVMVDLLGRKRVQKGTLDVGQAEARYTMTVTEAAERRGVHESAIRQAIHGKRLPAVKKGATWLVDPRDVSRLELRRAPHATPAQALETVPPLQALVGSDETGSFRIKAPDFVRTESKSGKIVGVVPAFRKVAVIFGPKGGYRLFVLERDDGENGEVTFGPFYVRGRFRVVEKVNNAREASQRWRDFHAA